MNEKRFLLRITFAVLLCTAVFSISSCRKEVPNVFDCPVSFVKPQQTLELTGTLLDFGESAPIGIKKIKVTDSLLVLQTKPSPHFYSFFRINGLQLVGSCIQEGRGPQEMVQPKMIDIAIGPDTGELPVYDSGSGKMFLIDLNVLPDGEKPSSRAILPGLKGFLYYIFPYRDSLAFIGDFTFKGDQLEDFILIKPGISPDTLERISLYPKVKADITTFASLLNSVIQLHPQRSILALPMFSLPQLNLLDLETGKRKTVSPVSPESFTDWRQLLKSKNVSSPSKDVIIIKPTGYAYTTASSTEQAILAIYNPETGKDQPTVMHIFDWDGNMLFDITVQQHLTSAALSPDGQYIYGLTSGDEIYRYTMPV